MNKYLFEMYENKDKGRVFKGYKSVRANSNAEAYEVAAENLDPDVSLFQVYIPQED